MKTGDIVEITGAYFKNDNGLYFVKCSPGDPNWSSSDYCLKKIGKTGKISTAKHNLCFWPICSYVSDRAKRAEARNWNEQHAAIEVKPPLQNMAEVVAHFQNEADNTTQYINRRAKWDFGEDSEVVKKYKAMATHYAAVAERIKEGRA